MRIAFYYQAGMVFTDGSFEGEGVGGSEASLILLARELAKMGHEVTIFNNCPEAGVFNGVRYEHFSVIRNGHAGRHERVRRMTKDQGLMTDFDVFVLFRCYQDLILRTMRGPVKVFWSCDLYENSGWTRNVVPYVDGIVAISGFH